MGIGQDRVGIGLITVVLLLFYALSVLQRSVSHYPLVVVEGPGQIRLTYVLHARSNKTDCDASAANLASTTQTACPVCLIAQQQCIVELDAPTRNALSENALETPSSRLPDGVVLYTASNAELALAACRESERMGNQRGKNLVTCYPAGTSRPLPQPAMPFNAAQVLWGLLTLVAAGLAAWSTCWLIIRSDHLHSHLSHDPTDSGPQKFHSAPTSRVGGMGLAAGMLAGGAVLLAFQPRFNFNNAHFGYLLLAGVPAFLGGIVEDVTKRILARTRLLMTMVSGALGAWLMGATLDRLDIPGIDAAFVYLPFAVAFTIFAVGGVANAINIIDGYNGLAGGFAVIVLAALAWVAAQVGDGFIFAATLTLIGALLGFLVWNWPNGKIFLGDGGAYLLGFLLAELSVLLVVRNPQVSPWFPNLLLAYPVFETLFSIYRRTWLRGHAAGRPDALHLHQMIYRRVVGRHVGSKDPQHLVERNSLVARYVWGATLLSAGYAVVFWQSASALMAGCAVLCATYVYVYRRIMLWRIPRWALAKPV